MSVHHQEEQDAAPGGVESDDSMTHVTTPRRFRAFDLVVGSVLCVALSPLIVVLAIGSAVSFRAWPFFVQERLGRDGATLRFPKIRTLPPDTPRYADKYALRPVETTRFGRFLRQTHLDELPQLFLVVRGHMSLVGPRPEMAAVAEEFDDRFVAVRTLARPGCTGLWQISEARGGLIGEAPEYDLHYLRHAGIRLNLWVLAHTLREVVPSADPVTLSDVPGWADGPGLLGPTHEAADLCPASVTVDLRDGVTDEPTVVHRSTAPATNGSAEPNGQSPQNGGRSLRSPVPNVTTGAGVSAGGH